MKKVSMTAALTAGALLAGASTAAAEDHSAEEVLKQSNEAMENLESFSSTMATEQTISDEMGDFNFQSTIEQDVFLDPFKLRQETTTTMEGAGEETLLSYWTEDGFFQEDGQGGWIKTADGTGDLEGMMYEPGTQIDEMQTWGDDLNLSEEDDYYVVTYAGDDFNFEDLMNQFSEMQGNETDGGMMEEMMGDVNISDVSYDLYIDKDNHYVVMMNSELTMEIEAEGETAEIEQSMEMEFHNFNDVEDFELPSEALEEAEDIEEIIDEELEEVEEEGDELPATASNQPLWTGVGLLFLVTAGGVLLTGRKTEKV
ncbi:DUF6612 family protein [Alkalicoccus halolimnae]|uniref:DUF6612 family protein n=1 Tax=Alkalicoccus halolimnae TaxID=1667239 RepID=A0A5C7F6B1_9BACI|nr:DUF6612 family protein [Alkalicoccus halolimnae]TXF84639.1 hypothetical protein FTX54_10590 [Alkalicoccus halolimnae]